MMSKTESRSKQFTIEEANAMLPLVRVIVADIVALANDVSERRQRLDHLLDGRDVEDKDPYSEELAHVERELDDDIQRLQGFENELADLGVELKSSLDGLVDFPAILEDREVFLCWKYDESEVAHWHDRSAGFDDRQSLTTTAGDPADLC